MGRPKRSGGKKGSKNVHTNKYANAPRGPKRPGRNSRKGLGQQESTIDDVVDDATSGTPSQQRSYVDQIIGRSTQNTKHTFTTTYEDSENLKCDSEGVYRAMEHWNRVPNDYISNRVDLILYEPKANLCLLVGCWDNGEKLKQQMKRLKLATGSIVETHENEDLGIQTTLAYSIKPEEVKANLNPEAIVLTGIPRGKMGANLLVAHSIKGSPGQRQLNRILVHYLQHADDRYFFR
jgi:hypothetical protein